MARQATVSPWTCAAKKCRKFRQKNYDGIKIIYVLYNPCGVFTVTTMPLANNYS